MEDDRLKNQETLKAVALSCRMMLKELSKFLLMHKEGQRDSLSEGKFRCEFLPNY